jgi:hypothetical protein
VGSEVFELKIFKIGSFDTYSELPAENYNESSLDLLDYELFVVGPTIVF